MPKPLFPLSASIAETSPTTTSALSVFDLTLDPALLGRLLFLESVLLSHSTLPHSGKAERMELTSALRMVRNRLDELNAAEEPFS